MNSKRPPASNRAVRFLARSLVDETGTVWDVLSTGGYFVQDPEVIMEVLPRLRRVLVKPARGVITEIPVGAAEPRLLAAASTEGILGEYGVRLYSKGQDLIAVIELAD